MRIKVEFLDEVRERAVKEGKSEEQIVAEDMVGRLA